MKQILACVVSIIFFNTVFTQQPYWQQEVNYTINVALNDKSHTLKGFADIDYINHSPDTLSYIWFHLWPNAYKNDKTALAKQLSDAKEYKKKLKNGDKGYIDSLDFKVNGQKAITEVHSENIDILKVILSQPLQPGQSVNVTTPFYVKLPSYFSRSGHDAQQYMVCQWYPKPAVYDKKGWHAFPYLDQGEFYSEFGTFKVNITLPSAYVVGATGTLQTKEELEKYKTIGSSNLRNKTNVINYQPVTPEREKTLEYYGANIHDFAWFADKDFIIQFDTLQLSSGKIVDVFSYSQPNGNKEWANSISFIEDAVVRYSDWIGEYPYPTVAAVEGPKNLASGGMEYPMITLITSPDAKKESLDAVIAHEVGHNWFYGILASNERDHPWMDEGLNTYFQFKYEAEKYRYNSVFGNSIPDEMKELPADQFLGRIYYALNNLPAREPIATNSTGFSNKEDYGIVVYLKTAIWMSIVEASIGKDNLMKGIKEYFNQWKFKHPYPEDLRESLEKGSGLGVSNLFELLSKRGNFQ